MLTGFLGSGKTTVLKRLSAEGHLARTLVLVNEFGEVGLDHHLLTPIDDDTLVAIESGCICCTIRADLVKTLKEAPWRYARNGERWFDRVVIETTGIADPGPILQTILGDDDVSREYLLTGVVTAVDVVNAISTFERHIEAEKQVAVADRVLLTKTDLDPVAEEAVRHRLAQIAPGIPVDGVIDGGAEPAWLFNNGLYALDGKSSDVKAWLRTDEIDHGHDHGAHEPNRHGLIRASCLTFDQPVDAALFETCLELLLRFRGPDLLRIKGIINVAGIDKPMVIHGVQHVFHPPEILDEWPDADRRTKVVIIARDLAQKELEASFAGLGLIPAGD